MEKSVKVSAKNIQYKYFWGKIQRIKTALGAKCNGKKLVVLAKNKQHKKNTKKTASGAKYYGEKRREFGKKHTIKILLGQNTTDQDGVGGEIQ
jgi:hypothetical protein